MQIATLWHVMLRALQDWWNDNCLRLAASLAYYTALSLAPLVLLIVGVVGLVLDRQQAIHQLTAQLEGLMGASGRELVTSILYFDKPAGGYTGDHRWAGHAVHWRHGRLWRAPGHDEPHLGSPASSHQRDMGRDMGLAPGTGLLAGHCLCARVPAARLARHQHHPRGGRCLVPRPGAGAPEPSSGARRFAPGPHLRVCLALQVRARCRDWLARGVARGAHHGGALYPRQDRHRLLPGPDERGVGLWRGRVDGGTPRVGLLLGPDHVFRRRVHARLGHAPGPCDPPATRRFGGSAPDQKRGEQRAPFEVMNTSGDLPNNWPSPTESN